MSEELFKEKLALFIKEKQDAGIGQLTLRKYPQKLNAFFGSFDYDLNPPKETLEKFLETLPNLSQKYEYLKHINPFLKFLDISYASEISSELFDMGKNLELQRKEAKDTKYKDINFAEIKKKFEELPETSYQEILRKLLLQMFIFENTILRGDIKDVKYKNYNSDNENHIMNGVITIIKTVKTGDKIEFAVSDATRILLSKLLEFPEALKSDYIFPFVGNCKTNKGRVEAMTRELKKLTKDFLGQELGVREIRDYAIKNHSDEVKCQIDDGEITLSEAVNAIAEKASSSNHSLTCHLKNYV